MHRFIVLLIRGFIDSPIDRFLCFVDSSMHVLIDSLIHRFDNGFLGSLPCRSKVSGLVALAVGSYWHYKALLFAAKWPWMEAACIRYTGFVASQSEAMWAIWLCKGHHCGATWDALAAIWLPKRPYVAPKLPRLLALGGARWTTWGQGRYLGNRKQ